MRTRSAPARVIRLATSLAEIGVRGRRLPVLPGVAEIGDHRGDAAGGGAAERIDDDQQLHQVVVGRVARRLDDEDVLAADVLLDLDEDLLVGEAPDHALGERDLEIGGDRLGQGAVGVAGDQFHAVRARKVALARGGGDSPLARAPVCNKASARVQTPVIPVRYFTQFARESMVLRAASLMLAMPIPVHGSPFLNAPPIS